VELKPILDRLHRFGRFSRLSCQIVIFC
jgi:hypothetical protein